MIDSLSISVPLEAVRIPWGDLYGHFEHKEERWGVTIGGNYRNLVISQRNCEKVTISGSLSKFHRGTSFDLTFEECQKAISGLCETFSIEPEEALLKRVDFARTIKTCHKPKLYYPFLGNHSKRLARRTKQNSLYYENSIKTLNFYDKAQEQGLIGNLLKYEARFFRPELTLKRKLHLVDLLTEQVYMQFVQSWESDYQNIEKVKTLCPMEALTSTKEFSRYLLARGAQAEGQEKLFSEIKIGQKLGLTSKQEAYLMRRKLKELFKSDLFIENELVRELDSKLLKGQ